MLQDPLSHIHCIICVLKSCGMSQSALQKKKAIFYDDFPTINILFPQMFIQQYQIHNFMIKKIPTLLRQKPE